VLLINDASTDNTYDKLLEWERKYPNQIFLFNNRTNIRQGASRNIGIKFATGKYIGFVDSDDWIESIMYETLITAAEISKCEVVNCCFYLNKDISPAVNTEIEPGADIFYYLLDDDNKSEFIVKNIIDPTVVTKIYKRDFLIDNSIFFPEGIIFEDHFFIEMINVYLTSYVLMTDKLYHYCMTPHSITRSGNSAAHYDIIIASNYLWNECIERGLFQKPYGASLEYRFIYYYWCIGLKMFTLFHDPIPYNTILQIKADILSKIPDCISNPYIVERLNTDSLVKILLKILVIPTTKNELKQIVDRLKQERLFIL